MDQSKLPTLSAPNGLQNSTGNTVQNEISDNLLTGISGLNLLCESERLKTFENWTVPFLNISDLASAGFYYLNRSDIVRCPFCSIEVGRWIEGDIPLDEHKKHSPHCRYLIERENVNNHGSDIGYDVCGSLDNVIMKSGYTDPDTNSQEVGLRKLGIQPNRPHVFPNYATYEKRLRSFKSWPVSELKPHMLTEAGFFYTGEGDRTICFHCGVALKDWNPTDNIWFEHARHFSRCNYVLLIKGKDFVDEVCGKKTEVQCLTKEEIMEIIQNHKEIVLIPTGEGSTANGSNVTSIKESTLAETTRSTTKNETDSMLCCVCYSEERNTAFLPCAHLVACEKCAISIEICAICRKPCEARLRVFLT